MEAVNRVNTRSTNQRSSACGAERRSSNAADAPSGRQVAMREQRVGVRTVSERTTVSTAATKKPVTGEASKSKGPNPALGMLAGVLYYRDQEGPSVEVRAGMTWDHVLGSLTP